MICTGTLLLNVMQTSAFSVGSAANALRLCLNLQNTLKLIVLNMFNPKVPQGRLSNASIVIKYFLVHQASIHTLKSTKVKILSSALSARKPSVPYQPLGDTAAHIASHQTLVTSLAPAKVSQQNNRPVTDHTSAHIVKRLSQRKVNYLCIFVPILVSNPTSVHSVRNLLHGRVLYSYTFVPTLESDHTSVHTVKGPLHSRLIYKDTFLLTLEGSRSNVHTVIRPLQTSVTYKHTSIPTLGNGHISVHNVKRLLLTPLTYADTFVPIQVSGHTSVRTVKRLLHCKVLYAIIFTPTLVNGHANVHTVRRVFYNVVTYGNTFIITIVSNHTLSPQSNTSYSDAFIAPTDNNY